MTQFPTPLSTLRRPRILIRAARAGVLEYRRERDLKRLLRTPGSAQGPALGTLMAEEDRLETTRAAGAATYDARRHVAVLTALIAEARLMSDAAHA